MKKDPTALYYLISKSKSEPDEQAILDALAISDIDAVGVEEIGANALDEAAAKGYLNVVKLLLANRADMYAADCYGSMPIHYAAKKGRYEIVKYFLDQGMDPNITYRAYMKPFFNEVPNYSLTTPLHSAVYSGSLETVQLLIEHGADVNAKNQNGCTPLFFAVRAGHAPIIELLLDNGADINASVASGGTPIFEARNYQIFKLLSDRGAKVNVTTKNGSTPLFDAVERKDIKTIKFLLNNGADINTKAENNNITALKEACAGSKEFLEKVLQYLHTKMNRENKSHEFYAVVAELKDIPDMQYGEGILDLLSSIQPLAKNAVTDSPTPSVASQIAAMGFIGQDRKPKTEQRTKTDSTANPDGPKL